MHKTWPPHSPPLPLHEQIRLGHTIRKRTASSILRQPPTTHQQSPFVNLNAYLQGGPNHHRYPNLYLPTESLSLDVNPSPQRTCQKGLRQLLQTYQWNPSAHCAVYLANYLLFSRIYELDFLETSATNSGTSGNTHPLPVPGWHCQCPQHPSFLNLPNTCTPKKRPKTTNSILIYKMHTSPSARRWWRWRTPLWI